MKLLQVLTAAGVIAAAPAFAHAKLQQSSPANGAQVTESPTTLTMSFNEAVTLAAVSITTGGKSVPVAVDREAKPSKTVVVRLPALEPGPCEVRWSAMSPADGHVMKGTLSFTVISHPSVKH
jgi:hypothetical protein